MSRLFYVVDEGPTRFYLTLDEAHEDAQQQIEECRDHCDPEWPSMTDLISVYECSAETDEPDEDGKLVLRATETDIREPEEGDTSVTYYCDYQMLPPAALTPAEDDKEQSGMGG